MKIKKTVKTAMSKSLTLPKTPAVLKNPAKQPVAVTKQPKAKTPKAEKPKKAPGIRWTTNGTKNEVCAAHCYGARRDNFIAGDGLKKGTIVKVDCGYNLVMADMPTTTIGPSAAIVPFKANGKAKSAKTSKVHRVMRLLPDGLYIVVETAPGKYTWGAERAKEREETRYAKVA